MALTDAEIDNLIAKAHDKLVEAFPDIDPALAKRVASAAIQDMLFEATLGGLDDPPEPTEPGDPPIEFPPTPVGPSGPA